MFKAERNAQDFAENKLKSIFVKKSLYIDSNCIEVGF